MVTWNETVLKESLELSRQSASGGQYHGAAGDVNLTSESGHLFAVTRAGNVSEFCLFYVAPVGAALESKWDGVCGTSGMATQLGYITIKQNVSDPLLVPNESNRLGVSLTSDRLIAWPACRSSGTVDGLTGSTKLGSVARSRRCGLSSPSYPGS